MKCITASEEIDEFGRSPRGERGLKSKTKRTPEATDAGRSPRGERGLKSAVVNIVYRLVRRSPRGERGLKFARAVLVLLVRCVAPREGSVG